MFIRKTKSKQGGKTYTYYALAESYRTDKGPRQRIVCSLGKLDPGPPEKWMKLAKKLEHALLGQPSLFDEELDEETKELIEKVRAKRKEIERRRCVAEDCKTAEIEIDGVHVENSREAGPLYVGHETWKKLDVDRILERAGLSERTRVLTEAMVLNRLIAPCSEHAMPAWFSEQVAAADLLGEEVAEVADDSLYRNMDRLHPEREAIEAALAKREKTLFNLDETVVLYDLTSTYFEGQAEANPKAKHGYSRDRRGDCKQLVIGLVMNGDGFPKAHEIFEGNRHDATTITEALDALERRTTSEAPRTVIVDRGMASRDNLELIKARGYHYLVAAKQTERDQFVDEFIAEDAWHQIIDEDASDSTVQKRAGVEVKQAITEAGSWILCRSEGRQHKDRAIRDNKEAKLIEDLEKLQRRIENGRIKNAAKIHQAIGRLKERHSRVARFYEITFREQEQTLRWTPRGDRLADARRLDGTYILKTDRTDMSPDDIWRTYMLLQRVERAFRDLKDPLRIRPIYHQKEIRSETHIFLAVLAYHLLVCIEKQLSDHSITASWQTVRSQLSTHRVCTIVLPTANGCELRLRRDTLAEDSHTRIYRALGLSEQIMKPNKVWIHDRCSV